MKVEVTGTVDKSGQLHLDKPLAMGINRRVRVIILFPEAEEIDEQEWLRAATTNPVFAFLHDPEEDIYTLEDGKPV